VQLDNRNNIKPANQMMIQVVDDEFDIVNIIKLYLQGIGYNAFGFMDSSLAFEHFRINCKNYTLVISDIRMPGINGFELARKIREINPAIKVLLMSAFEVNSTELAACLGSTRIDGFIQKPVALHELKTIVQEQLEMKTLL
jgi:DNA-binding NtrC family response regulator